MGTIAPAPPQVATTLPVGGVRRRRFVVVAVALSLVIVGLIVGITWITNYAPLTVDTT